jgi:hypothetical protein
MRYFVAAKTSMSSKILGVESDFFSEMCVNAATRVKLEQDGKIKCPINNVHILKSHGMSSLDSTLVDGFALNCTRASQAMPTKLSNVKIALLDFNLQKHKMQMGVQIVVKDTKQVFSRMWGWHSPLEGVALCDCYEGICYLFSFLFDMLILVGIVISEGGGDQE